MRIKSIFPEFNVKVTKSDLKKFGNDGQYIHSRDVIVLDRTILDIPAYRDIVLLHEMFHSTGADSRLNRIERLEKFFGSFEDKSKAYQVEECIVEICTIIAAAKLNMLNKYTLKIVDQGLIRYYNNNIYIPWREVTAALHYFSPEEDFTKETAATKKYLASKYRMNIKDTYELGHLSA